MVEKMRWRGFGERTNLKNYVAYVLFGAIILVFAFVGVSPDQYGESGGGVAAVVNDSPISLAEYRNRVESIEENIRLQFDQFPEAQRRAFSQEMRREALERLINEEVVFQVAQKKGVLAADGEVRDLLLQIPQFQENGRFRRDRYQNYLSNVGMTSEEFERRIRKQIVMQKLQELFVGSAIPSREELERNRSLSNMKVNVRFAEITRDNLEKPELISAAEVTSYAQANAAAIEQYYNSNKIEFTAGEKVKARHILIRVDEKQPDAQAKQKASDLRAKATVQNFAQLATQNSDDPGSKSKGGDLGDFERGRMMPEFEEAAFALKEGEISTPVKTDFGYHLIYVEKKTPSQTTSLADATPTIARKLLLRTKENEIIAQIRAGIEKGGKKEADMWVQKTGSKWQETGEFDLSATSIPKLGDEPTVLRTVLKSGKPGMVNQVVTTMDGKHYLLDVVSFKTAQNNTPEVEGFDRMLAARKSSNIIETWAKEAQATARISRNPQLQ